ncbi:MAG: hypothetical protein ABIP30_13875 [Ferruginibacter sp.]
MKVREMKMVPLFEKLIKDSTKGLRCQHDGSRIKPQSIQNYMYVLANLKEYELLTCVPLRLKIFKGYNQREQAAERLYWKKFYLDFTDFLFKKKLLRQLCGCSN